MAQKQFNDWDPTRSGLEGNMMAEPRLFAHDAAAVTIGALNSSDADYGILITNAGAGYEVDMVIATTGSATGSGAEVKVLGINAPSAAVVNDDLAAAITTNQTDFVDNTYTGTVGTTAGYTTSGAGTGLIITVTVAGNTVTKVNVDSAGTGFVAGDTVTVTGSGGVLGGATGNLVITLGTGSISKYELEDVGATYLVGDTLTQNGATTPAGGLGFACTVTNIDIPNTQKRGCCVYNGSAAAQDITVVMEGAAIDTTTNTGYDKSVTWKNVPSGAMMPMQIVQLVAGTDILALY